MTTPTLQGNFFEDFSLGQNFQHGVPRTITEADASLYLALTGSRFALYCAKTVAQMCGFQRVPLDNLLVFHVAFGKTVNDISLNAIANLGYAEVQFLLPVFAGDTLAVTSEVIGLKENSNGKSGIVFVHSVAKNQDQQIVLSWKRWVMVAKSTVEAPPPKTHLPEYQPVIPSEKIAIPTAVNLSNWENHWADKSITFDSMQVGDSLFHRDGMTINDSDHSLATRLYQNNARVHFDQHMMASRPTPKRLVYGGHIISICRALTYNGLGNAIWLSGINAGTHANPTFAGDTIYCQSEILEKVELPNHSNIGAVRLRMLGIKNNTPATMPYLYQQEKGRLRYHSDCVLDLDYWALMPRG